MSSRRHSTSSSSPAKRRREDLTLEEAWALYCKHSWAGSRRAVWKWVAWPGTMPRSLVYFAPGGRYFDVNPPLPPMSGDKFEDCRAQWEMDRANRAAARARYAPHWEEGGSSSAVATAGTAAAAEEADEEELFRQAVEASKQEAAKRAAADAEEEALAIAAVEELKKAEAAAAAVIVIDDD